MGHARFKFTIGNRGQIRIVTGNKFTSGILTYGKT
jgi:hypothetical protein